MTDPMPLCAATDDLYCNNCDVLVGLPGLRVLKATRNAGQLMVVLNRRRR